MPCDSPQEYAAKEGPDKKFPVITISDESHTLMQELALAAFALGEAQGRGPTDAAYTGLSRARERLALHLERLERAAPPDTRAMRVYRTVRFR